MKEINNTEENKELEELRQQMNIVRGKLDATLTLDAKLLQTRIKMEKRQIQNFAFWYTAGGAVAAALLKYVFDYFLNAPIIGVVLAVLCIVECYYHMYISRKVKNLGYTSLSMKDTIRRLIHLKKQLNLFTIIDLCVISPIILIWCTYEIWIHIIPESMLNDTLFIAIYIFIVLCSSFIGIITEWFIISRQRRNINKMIDTLQEVTEL